MTIAVGMLATNGVVLAADTQLTYGSFAKSEGGKVMAVSKRGVSAWGVTGATDRYGYLASLGQTLARDFETHIDAADKASTAIRTEELLHEFHERHVIPFPDLPAINLLIGYQKGKELALWKSDRSTLSEYDDAAAVGIGEYVANGLLSRYWTPLLSIPQAIALATYVISVVKRSVDGCGLYTQVIAIEESCHYLVAQSLVNRIDDLWRSFIEDVEPAILREALGAQSFKRGQTPEGFRVQMAESLEELEKRKPNRVRLMRAARALKEKSDQQSPTDDPKDQPPSQESPGASDES
jgi:20S proteasome alpha/beta subunit